jgi:hypothetical protein
LGKWIHPPQQTTFRTSKGSELGGVSRHGVDRGKCPLSLCQLEELDGDVWQVAAFSHLEPR